MAQSQALRPDRLSSRSRKLKQCETASVATTTDTAAPQRTLGAAIWTVRNLLENREIRIPDYQRPYKWSVRSVGQLLDDIDTFRRSGRYRIGTVILHQNESGHLDVVDGQQRFLTLSLVAQALNGCGIAVPDVSDLELPEVGLSITQANLQDNFNYIREALSRHNDLAGWSEFLLEQCEVVVVTLTNVDEAFQMFDSQNTRGRPLFPTDLLKAFHIREMSSEHAPPELKLAMVRLWEDIPPESINELFSDYLFKIRRWANGREVPAAGFASEHVHVFKGIRESEPNNAHNRWAMPYLYAKNYTDDFRQENGTLIRYGAMRAVDYPFQIDQPVLNGETFFMMVRHYYERGLRLGLFRDDPAEHITIPGVAETVASLDTHRNSSTHQLVRNVFDCLLLYYVDRFGEQELERAVDVIVRYAMALRVQQLQVRRVMVSNYALGNPPTPTLPKVNLFAELREAMSARDFVRRTLPAPDMEHGRYPELHGFFKAEESA